MLAWRLPRSRRYDCQQAKPHCLDLLPSLAFAAPSERGKDRHVGRTLPASAKCVLSQAGVAICGADGRLLTGTRRETASWSQTLLVADLALARTLHRLMRPV
jgi:hypothetical protein